MSFPASSGTDFLVMMPLLLLQSGHRLLRMKSLNIWTDHWFEFLSACLRAAQADEELDLTRSGRMGKVEKLPRSDSRKA